MNGQESTINETNCSDPNKSYNLLKGILIAFCFYFVQLFYHLSYIREEVSDKDSDLYKSDTE